MKRIILILALVLGLAGGNAVMAQAPAGGQASPLRTRVALINMVHILKNYKKFLDAETNLKAQIKQVETQLEPKKTDLMTRRAAYQAEKDATKRDQMEREMRKIVTELKEMEEDATKGLSVSQGKLAVQIFKEVEEAVKLFARVNDIELVLMYNDAQNTEATQLEFYSPANVQRKITFPGLLPIHYDSRMDISGAVIQMLNDRIPGGTAAPSGQ